MRTVHSTGLLASRLASRDFGGDARAGSVSVIHDTTGGNFTYTGAGLYAPTLTAVDDDPHGWFDGTGITPAYDGYYSVAAQACFFPQATSTATGDGIYQAQVSRGTTTLNGQPLVDSGCVLFNAGSPRVIVALSHPALFLFAGTSITLAAYISFGSTPLIRWSASGGDSYQDSSWLAIAFLGSG